MAILCYAKLSASRPGSTFPTTVPYSSSDASDLTRPVPSFGPYFAHRLWTSMKKKFFYGTRSRSGRPPIYGREIWGLGIAKRGMGAYGRSDITAMWCLSPTYLCRVLGWIEKRCIGFRRLSFRIMTMDIWWTWVCDRLIDLCSAKNDFCFSTTKTHGIYVLVSFVVCVLLFSFFLPLGGEGPISSLPLSLSHFVSTHLSCYERGHVEEPKVMHCIGRSRVHFTKHYTAGQRWKTIVHRKKEIWAVSPIDFVRRNKDQEMNRVKHDLNISWIMSLCLWLVWIVKSLYNRPQ
jgi:hypothetical protein